MATEEAMTSGDYTPCGALISSPKVAPSGVKFSEFLSKSAGKMTALEVEQDGGDKSVKMEKAWGKPGKILPIRKAGLVFAGFFRGKTASEGSVGRNSEKGPRKSTSWSSLFGKKACEKETSTSLIDRDGSQMVKQEGARKVSRTPSRIIATQRRVKVGHPTRKNRTVGVVGKGVKHKDRVGEEGAENRGDELCKKRILMGGKCKPLNSSGVLEYDANGFLLPDNVR